MENKNIDLIEKEVFQIFENSKGSHDLEHTLRVRKLALHIGKIENANLEIIEISALLHDIAREYQDKSNGKICHAELGSELAEKILLNLEVDENIIFKVKNCIKSHRYRGKNIPSTIEEKVLYDADKLDSIGAIGIGRAFVFSGENGASVHCSKLSDGELINKEDYSRYDTAYREFLIKLSKIKDKMLTDEGKKIASERHKFMCDFFKRLKKEVEGEV